MSRQLVRTGMKSSNSRLMSSTTPNFPRHPYRFYVGASWAAKPIPVTFQGQRPKTPFPPDGTIGSWRDKLLSWPKSFTSKLGNDAGEDFFYVQEVGGLPSHE